MNRLDTTQPWELTPEQQQRLRRDINPDGWFEHEQIERCAKAVRINRAAEDIVGAILRYNQSTEGIQRARKPASRPRGTNADGSLYRSGTHMQSTEGQLRCGCAACLASLGPLARGYRRLR